MGSAISTTHDGMLFGLICGRVQRCRNLHSDCCCRSSWGWSARV